MLFQHMLQQTTHDDDTHVGYFNMAVFAVLGMSDAHIVITCMWLKCFMHVFY